MAEAKPAPVKLMRQYGRDWKTRIGNLVLDATDCRAPQTIKDSLGLLDDEVNLTVRKKSWPAGWATRLTFRCHGRNSEGYANRFSYAHDTCLPRSTSPPPLIDGVTPMEVVSPASPPPEAPEPASADVISDALGEQLIKTTADNIWKQVGEARKAIKDFVDERAGDFVVRRAGYTDPDEPETNFSVILSQRGHDFDLAAVFHLLQGGSVKLDSMPDRVELRPLEGRAFISAKTGRDLTRFLTAVYWTYNKSGRCGKWHDLYPEKLRFGAENNCWVDQK